MMTVSANELIVYNRIERRLLLSNAIVQSRCCVQWLFTESVRLPQL